jgi:capsular polysaccharide biosynthesis protein
MQRQKKSSGPRALRRSIVSGLVLALLTLGAGAALAATQQPSYTAEAVLVVLPKATLDDATSAAFYETMSRGQIVGTFAEVADNPTFERSSAAALGLSAGQQKKVTTTVSVVPDTSVILVRVSAGGATVAEQLADRTAALASTYLAELSNAYRIQIVHPAQGSAASSGISATLMLILAGVVAVGGGVAVQQAVYHLMVARRLTVAEPAPAVPAPVAAAQGAVAHLAPAGRR